MDAQDQDLIDKYLNNALKEHEVHLLLDRLQHDQDYQHEFRQQVQEKFLIDHWRLSGQLDSRNHQDLYSRLFRESPKERTLTVSWWAVAATITLLTLLGIGIWKMNTAETAPMIVLRLADGTERIIQETDSGWVANEHGEDKLQLLKNLLDYTAFADDTTDQHLTFNELSVPDGKRFHVRLADGTSVYLNSGSVFTYPVNFVGAQERRVFLKGEGYFEAAKDPSHPFLVETGQTVVKVLGTHFNVQAYPEETTCKTTLAEGSVQVQLMNDPHVQVRISPGEAAIWSADQNDQLTVTTVLVENDIAWIQNHLLFVDEAFSVIRRKIERSYGVRIVNADKALDNIHFYGDFDIEHETVTDVMDAFSKMGYFQYTTENGLITIQNESPM